MKYFPLRNLKLQKQIQDNKIIYIYCMKWSTPLLLIIYKISKNMESPPNLPSMEEKWEPEPVKLIWDLRVEERKQSTYIIHAMHLWNKHITA